MLLLATAMQSQLPKLIQATADRAAFEKSFRSASLSLYKITLAGISAIVAIAAILHSNLLGDQYRGAATPLLVLAATLPARAFLLLAGAAAVARGWFSISSSISVVEILLIICATTTGLVKDANLMAVSVVVATWGAVFPGYILLRLARNVPDAASSHSK